MQERDQGPLCESEAIRGTTPFDGSEGCRNMTRRVAGNPSFRNFPLDIQRKVTFMRGEEHLEAVVQSEGA